MPARPRPHQQMVDEFWARLDRSGECWLWTGSQVGGGYGQIHFGQRTFLTHRLAYELAICPIPDGWMVCHRCDVRLCCRPSHLFLGTAAINNADMARKGRHGIRKGHTKRRRLTPDQVVEIRKRYASEPHGLGRPKQRLTASPAALAAEFGVSPSTIRAVVRGQSWKQVPA